MTEDELNELIRPLIEEDSTDLDDFTNLAYDDPKRWAVIFRHMARHLRRAEIIMLNTDHRKLVWAELTELGEELESYANIFFDTFAPPQEVNTDLLRTLTERLEKDGTITLDKATVLDIIRTHRPEQLDDDEPPKHPGMYL